MTDGLPAAEGTMTYALAATADAFYAVPHVGDVYRSVDPGKTWEALGVGWGRDGAQGPYVNAVVVVE